MRAATFVWSTALIVVCICSSNVQALEFNDDHHPALSDNVLKIRDWQAGHALQIPVMVDDSGDDWFVVAVVGQIPPTVDTRAIQPIDEEAALHRVQPRGFVQSLIAYSKAQIHTDSLASYLTESLGHWRTFLQDNHIGFAFKSHSWAIGGLID